MANRDDDEKLSNETETVELSSEDEHDVDYEDDEKASDAPKKKKGGLGKILGIAGAVVAVGAIVFTGNKIFFSDNSAPPAQNQNENQQAQAPVPVAQTPQSQPEVSQPQPQPQQEQAQTTAPVPQVSNGEEVLPDLHQGSVTTENPNSSSLADNTTSASVTENKVPESASVATPSQTPTPTPTEATTPEVAPDLGQADVKPMPSVGQNVTQNNVTHSETTPVISNENAGELNKSIQALIVKMDGLSTSLESLNNMIGDTNDRIDKTNTNVDNLSKRVDKLEDMLNNKSSVAAVAGAAKDDCDNKKVTKPVVKKSSKGVVKKKKSSGVSNTRYNSVEIIDEDAPRSHRKAYVAPKKSSSTASSRLGGGYTLQSVVTDRAWVKHPNGTTSTYGIGDRLPNGKIVGSIDPDNGVYDTNGKLVLK